MANAISETLSSIIGSSVTTIAGFIALCFMSFTLGMDLGIVMSKGVWRRFSIANPKNVGLFLKRLRVC